MSRYKFKSLAHPNKYGYAYDQSSYSSSSETSGYFRQFETYGDGLTQHSGDWSVTFEYLTDFLGSLAAAMLDDAPLAERVGSALRSHSYADAIAFAASVVWRESDSSYYKRRYVSMSLRKIGSKDKYEHDNRFVEIEKWMDGSCAAVLRMLLSTYSQGFERYTTYEAVRLWAAGLKKHPGFGESWPEYFNGDWHKNNALRGALGACRNIHESLRLRKDANDWVVYYRELQVTAAEVAAVVAATAAGDAAEVKAEV
jgi:hypothetical protein